MTRRTSLAVLAGGLFAGAARAQSTQGHGAQVPSDGSAPREDRVRDILRDWVDVRRRAVGVAAAVVSPAGTYFVNHGRLSATDPRPVARDSVFYTASVTKGFTGLLLADSVRRGELALSDPAQRYLPDTVRLPMRNGQAITLFHLASHTSGLPQDIPEPDGEAALAASRVFTMKPVHDFVSGFTLPTDPGAAWSYSNLGYALLGEVLARRTGVAFPELMRRRIADPLALSSTAYDASPPMAARQAGGHREDLSPEPYPIRPWALPAGGLQSTTADLARFAAAFVGLVDSPLAPAMSDVVRTTRSAPFGFGDFGLGWWTYPNTPTLTIAGLGRGFASSVVIDRAARTAVVVLSNTRRQVLDLGTHLLYPDEPLDRSPTAASATVSPDPELDPFVGRYQVQSPSAPLPEGAVLEVLRESDHLALQIPGAPRGPLTRRSATRFEIAGFPVAVDFVRAAGVGPATALTLTLRGQPIQAIRQP